MCASCPSLTPSSTFIIPFSRSLPYLVSTLSCLLQCSILGTLFGWLVYQAPGCQESRQCVSEPGTQLGCRARGSCSLKRPVNDGRALRPFHCHKQTPHQLEFHFLIWGMRPPHVGRSTWWFSPSPSSFPPQGVFLLFSALGRGFWEPNGWTEKKHSSSGHTQQWSLGENGKSPNCLLCLPALAVAGQWA